MADWLQLLKNYIGYEGATSLANKLTAARAAFLDAAISTRAIPGDAMALTAAERLLVQALLINDVTPFPGGNIDAAVSSREASGAATAALAAVAYTRQAGVMQSKATTADLQRVGGTYDLLTGAITDVIVEKLVIRMSGGAVGGTVTGISIQTNDNTPQIFVAAADALVAVLTDQAQRGYDGAIMIKAGKKIQLTIANPGGAGAANLADVVVFYRAVASGGSLT